MKNYKSRIKKKKKKHDKIVLLAKTNLNTIEVLISKALIELNISRDEFVSVNNVLKEYDVSYKQEIKCKCYIFCISIIKSLKKLQQFNFLYIYIKNIDIQYNTIN